MVLVSMVLLASAGKMIQNVLLSSYERFEELYASKRENYGFQRRKLLQHRQSVNPDIVLSNVIIRDVVFAKTQQSPTNYRVFHVSCILKFIRFGFV